MDRRMGNRKFARVLTRARDQGYSLADAWKLAVRWTEAKQRAETYDLDVSWEDEDIPWEDLRGDAETEHPPIWTCAVVWDPGPHYRKGESVCRASLGGIGLNAWSDAYVYEVEADVLTEACDNVDAERERDAQAQADELAARATFAGVSP